MTPQQKVLEIAKKEVGYLEKKTNANLDDKTKNAGSNNYTKFARDLDKVKACGYNLQAQPWCAAFVFWCYTQAFGLNNAFKITNTKKGDNIGGSTNMSSRYKAMKRFYTSNPQPGDQVFFYNSSKTAMAHTGIVYKVENGRVYTIEGNTSGASGVIDNGGGVCIKNYSLSYSRIGGYGRPQWAYVEQKEEDEDMTDEKFAELMERYEANLAKKKATYEQEALDWCVKNGILQGNVEGNLMAKRHSTRGELAVMLQRFANKLLKK